MNGFVASERVQTTHFHRDAVFYSEHEKDLMADDEVVVNQQKLTQLHDELQRLYWKMKQLRCYGV